MDKVYVGLDLGSSFFQQAALNQEGRVTMNRRFPTSEANLRSAFTGLRGEIQGASGSRRVSTLGSGHEPLTAATSCALLKRQVDESSCSYRRRSQTPAGAVRSL